MAKLTNTEPRTEPKSLNESTLESNIASEIASLFNSTFNFGYPHRLHWLFEFHRFNHRPFFDRRRCRVIRLTPIEENKGGGWDSKIVVPTSNRGKRAIFVQFKAGHRRDGNEVTNSIFNYAIYRPNPHVEFEFNGNAGNQQHQTLKTLSDRLVANGLPEKSVMYGFPRITEVDVFENLEEDLLLHTTFLTISEMDIAAENAMPPQNLYDGNAHFFRTSYDDETRMEIASEPFLIKESSFSDGFLYELLLVKMNRLRNGLIEFEPARRINDYIFFQLAVYLNVNPLETVKGDTIFRYIHEPEISDYFRSLNDYKERKNLNNINSGKRRLGLFEKVVEFFIDKDNRISDEEIPQKYTFSLPREKEIEISLEIKNTKDISFSLITF